MNRSRVDDLVWLAALVVFIIAGLWVLGLVL